jgi:DNA-binding CsgD family transcriptional regulator
VDAAVFGRDAELMEIDAVLGAAASGFAGLVLEGDAGIGKTTVWRRGIDRAAARDYRVLSCRTAPAEARLSFAALGDLLAPLDRAAFDALPDPQRRALDAALLRADPAGAAPNPRAIGIGIVSLLSALAASAPIVLAIDDVQWLDRPSARALEFAFRRLEPHPVAVLATRRIGVRDRGNGLLAIGPGERTRTLRLGPLSLAALYRMVEDQLGRKLPRPLLARVERASAGNPFYALEIARTLGARPAAGEELPIPDDLSQLVAERLRKLPQRTREALLRVSALAQPTLALVAPGSLAPAEEAGLVRVATDGRIEFAHPLFASGIYAAAPRERRRKLHTELAESAVDVEERARHLMLASPPDAQDERVAALLHEAAQHAARRGAAEIAAELSERAAQLTPAPQIPLRHERLLRAAEQHAKAGDLDRARGLCEAVLGAASEGPVRAEALLVRAVTTSNARPAEAIRELEEALACAGGDSARVAQLEVALAATHVLGFDLAAAIRHAARAVEFAERSADTTLLAEALAMREVGRVLSGQPLDEAALARALALEDLEAGAPFRIRPSLSAAGAYAYVERFDVARALLVRTRERLLAGGDVLEMPWIHCLLAITSHAGGELERAELEANEAERAAALTGRDVSRVLTLMVRATTRAVRGDAPGTRADAAETQALSERMGWPYGAIGARFALGHLALSEGDPEAATGILEPPVRMVQAVGVYAFPIAIGVPDLIEALVATGNLERAAPPTDAFAAWGRRFDRPWALATSARCEALLAAATGDFDRALASAGQALIAHERLPMPFERGRTLLVLGQVQRRAGERRAARETLQQALSVFERVGAGLWAKRAAAEIARIGVRRAPDALTESEERVAELAAQGFTNPEIAARLFMSRRTVEANLARAYRKLDIRSRAELGATMARRKAGSPS